MVRLVSAGSGCLATLRIAPGSNASSTLPSALACNGTTEPVTSTWVPPSARNT